MPESCVAASNTPLWSLIPAMAGCLSWLREVNQLVCVTPSQASTIVLGGGCIYVFPAILGTIGLIGQTISPHSLRRL